MSSHYIINDLLRGMSPIYLSVPKRRRSRKGFSPKKRSKTKRLSTTKRLSKTKTPKKSRKKSRKKSQFKKTSKQKHKKPPSRQRRSPPIQSSNDKKQIKHHMIPMTRKKRELPLCGVKQAVQYGGTCWIASTVMIIYNNPILWNFMNRTVQTFVRDFVEDARRALRLRMGHDLRDDFRFNEECRNIPTSISRYYKHWNLKTGSYIKGQSGGNPYLLFKAFAWASGHYVEDIWLGTKRRHLHPIIGLEFCEDDLDCSNIHLSSEKLFDVTQRCKKIDNYICHGGFITIPNHVFGFVKCDNYFVLCQSWYMTGCIKIRDLSLSIRQEYSVLEYDSKNLRSSIKQPISNITFIYVQDENKNHNSVEFFNDLDAMKCDLNKIISS